MRTSFALIVIQLIGFSIGFAQSNEALQDFKKLNEHYTSLSKYSMDFTVEYVGQGKRILMTQEGHVTHASNLHYTNVAGVTTLMRDGEFVSVNGSGKFIVYSKSEQKVEQETQKSVDISAMLDSMWTNQTNFKCTYLKVGKGQKKVFIEDRKSTHYDAYSITIDSKSYQLLEYTYYVKASADSDLQEIRIKYSNERAKPKLNLDYLKVNYYLAGKVGNLRPTERFVNYEIVDQTQNQATYEN